ncbi:TPA: hypothetical protein HA270_02840 [Candidatus Woesearchaeota archaeon]|nr:hypothetical protein [Candidatus Woesearchaeota archaeon]
MLDNYGATTGLEGEVLGNDVRLAYGRITGWKRGALLDNLILIQLNEYCWHQCPDCGVGGIAKNGGGKSIDYDFLEQLAGELDEVQKERIALQYRSDPFNYESQGHKTRDAYNLFEGSRKLITAVPPGKEDDVLANLDIIGVISVHDDRREHMSNSGFMGCLTKEMELHPEYRIRVVYDNGWIKLGHRNISGLSPYAMHSFHGAAITPTQIYSQRVVKPSLEHPYGAIETPVDPDSFRIAALAEFPHYALPGDIILKYNEGFLNSYHEIISEETMLHKPFNYWLSHKFTLIRPILLEESSCSEKPDLKKLEWNLDIMFAVLNDANKMEHLSEFEDGLRKDLNSWYKAGTELRKNLSSFSLSGLLRFFRNTSPS